MSYNDYNDYSGDNRWMIVRSDGYDRMDYNIIYFETILIIENYIGVGLWTI